MFPGTRAGPSTAPRIDPRPSTRVERAHPAVPGPEHLHGQDREQRKHPSSQAHGELRQENCGHAPMTRDIAPTRTQVAPQATEGGTLVEGAGARSSGGEGATHGDDGEGTHQEGESVEHEGGLAPPCAAHHGSHGGSRRHHDARRRPHQGVGGRHLARRDQVGKSRRGSRAEEVRGCHVDGGNGDGQPRVARSSHEEEAQGQDHAHHVGRNEDATTVEAVGCRPPPRGSPPGR